MKLAKKNKLIVDFMDIIPECEYLDPCRYHSDWNDLIKVVEKIENLGYEVFIETFEVRIEKFIDVLVREHTKVSDQSKIQAVHNACIKFIKFYNKNKQS